MEGRDGGGGGGSGHLRMERERSGGHLEGAAEDGRVDDTKRIVIKETGAALRHIKQRSVEVHLTEKETAQWRLGRTWSKTIEYR